MSDPAADYPKAKQYRDRHGKMRWRYRKGDLQVGLRGAPGEPGFDAAYKAAEAGMPIRHLPPGRDKYAPEGIIYVVQGDPGTPVKIGFTAPKMLGARLSNLQTGNPSLLRVIAQAKGYQRHERMVHRALAVDRVFREWFAWSDRVQAFTGSLNDGIDAALSVAIRLSWRTTLG